MALINWLLKYHDVIKNIHFNRMYMKHGEKLKRSEKNHCNCKDKQLINHLHNLRAQVNFLILFLILLDCWRERLTHIFHIS